MKAERPLVLLMEALLEREEAVFFQNALRKRQSQLRLLPPVMQIGIGLNLNRIGRIAVVLFM